jgi:hypothetical protein
MMQTQQAKKSPLAHQNFEDVCTGLSEGMYPVVPELSWFELRQIHCL